MTVFILVGCLYGIPAAWRYLHGERDLPQLWVVHYDTVEAAALMIAGVIIGAVGLYLNRNPNRLVYDRQTGRNVRAGAQHTAYYIPIEWLGLAAVAGGALMLFKHSA